ncbi:hypothetical protein BT63DRAFT_459433 [Microthyrium microscopicum]|uniref:Uncharacterized protein n=1 Tax=Microthyrium microscopicum TaxID=703497 RepID=A0A6A6TYC1_9PEZI|nr:hypothetical protein BT63DRAFT_459433 [Microthyrium microscopicum]
MAARPELAPQFEGEPDLLPNRQHHLESQQYHKASLCDLVLLLKAPGLRRKPSRTETPSSHQILFFRARAFATTRFAGLPYSDHRPRLLVSSDPLLPSKSPPTHCILSIAAAMDHIIDSLTNHLRDFRDISNRLGKGQGWSRPNEAFVTQAMMDVTNLSDNLAGVLRRVVSYRKEKRVWYDAKEQQFRQGIRQLQQQVVQRDGRIGELETQCYALKQQLRSLGHEPGPTPGQKRRREATDEEEEEDEEDDEGAQHVSRLRQRTQPPSSELPTMTGAHVMGPTPRRPFLQQSRASNGNATTGNTQTQRTQATPRRRAVPAATANTASLRNSTHVSMLVPHGWSSMTHTDRAVWLEGETILSNDLIEVLAGMSHITAQNNYQVNLNHRTKCVKVHSKNRGSASYPWTNQLGPCDFCERNGHHCVYWSSELGLTWTNPPTDSTDEAE